MDYIAAAAAGDGDRMEDAYDRIPLTGRWRWGASPLACAWLLLLRSRGSLRRAAARFRGSGLHAGSSGQQVREVLKHCQAMPAGFHPVRAPCLMPAA